MNKTPTVLIIMDGFGIAPASEGNAVSSANTPRLDGFFQEFAHTVLAASGEDVGLPPGQIGNSEIGHIDLGAGRIVGQDFPRINGAIADGSFFRNPAYLQAMDRCLERETALHLVGLLSEGGVHSHISHLFALLRMAKDKGIERVFIHAILDGKDVPPATGAEYIRRTEEACASVGVGKIATVMGRGYAMDRGRRWDRVEEAYDAMVYGESREDASSAVAAVQRAYSRGVTDEQIEPVVCDGEGTISDHDSVIFFNFRPEGCRALVRSLADPAFAGFTRQYFPLTTVCTAEYQGAVPNILVAFPRLPIRNGLGEYLSDLGLTQLRLAEEERFAHVTVFFNGGMEEALPGEDRISIPSPKTESFDRQPEMSAREVCEKCIERMESGMYDMIVLNFANCDAVGHTGNLFAAVRAVEIVDHCVGAVVDAALKMGGIAMITSDHGNAEEMRTPDGAPVMAGTMNPVPFILCGAGSKLRPGTLADVAPTVLDVMGLACPEEMDGNTLIVE